MALATGQTLSFYEILGPLGAGGMGEVYRARDTRLEREVAIKVLPEELADDEERLRRFEREAKTLASLNHPNVAGIHGVDQEGDVCFLALELVPGEDLAQRLARGPLPVDEALDVCRQIAEGLEVAHEAGVVHRDLKPANVRITPDGVVKLLDFGLAKLIHPHTSKEGTSKAQSDSFLLTSEGMVLGTPTYMSPEQARGKPVDRRTDIWAFGCVLYECLTGKRAFEGEAFGDLIAAILEHDVDIACLPTGTPAHLRRLLHRALTKDPRTRLRDIGEARVALGEGRNEPSDGLAENPHAVGRWLALGLGAALGALATFALFFRGDDRSVESPASAPGQVIRSVITLPESAPLAYGAGPIGFDSPLLALSPDGGQLVYVGESETGSQLYVHELASFDDPRPIPGTEGALYSFFSPDGEWLGFVTRDKLMKVSLPSLAPQPVCVVPAVIKAWWTEGEVIWFVDAMGRGIQRVPASGGDAEEVRIGRHWFVDHVLPGGRWALIRNRMRGISGDHANVHAFDLDTLESRPVLESGYDPRYLPTGHLLFARAGNLIAAPLLLEEPERAEQETTVVRGVAMDSLFCQAQVAVSPSGTLAYVPGAERAKGRIAWVDRDGNEGVLPLEPGLYGVFDLAPDDVRLAIQVSDVTDSIWIYDIERERGHKLTGTTTAGWPLWNPAGDSVAFCSGSYGTGEWNLMTQKVAGGHEPILLATIETDVFSAAPASWSPDGSVLAVQSGDDLGFVSAEGEPGADWLSPDGVLYFQPAFSPNGRWVAYSSSETGELEIRVRSYPDGAVDEQLSSRGGIEPVWCWSTGEVIYRDGNTWYASKVTLEPELDIETPRVVFQTEFIDTPGVSYDVSSDGQRLFVLKPTGADERRRIHVVTNWFAELERLVPSGD